MDTRFVKPILVCVLAVLTLAGCSTPPARSIGLLEAVNLPISELKASEVPRSLREASDGVGFFIRAGHRGVYVVHPIQPGIRLAVKGVYGDPGRIVVEVTEASDAAGAKDASPEFQVPSQSVASGTAALAVLLPQVPTDDGRSILVRYDSVGSLYLGKNLKTVEAVCHPSTAYSGVRYFFDPVDARITESLFVDKGPNAIGEKVTAMELKEGEPVMVTYIVPDKGGEPPQIVDVVRKPTVGMPGGPQ